MEDLSEGGAAADLVGPAPRFNRPTGSVARRRWRPSLRLDQRLELFGGEADRHRAVGIAANASRRNLDLLAGLQAIDDHCRGDRIDRPDRRCHRRP